MGKTEIRDRMPEDGEAGWYDVPLEPNLRAMFSPNRQLEGRDSNGVLRKTIDIALAGSTFQAIRLDPFSKGAHYHIRPVRGEDQIPLEVAEGQAPLEAALAIFTNPKQLREMLEKAEPGVVMDHDFLNGLELDAAAAQIRAIDARVSTA